MKAKTQRRAKSSLDTIVIESSGDLSYGEILLEVKGDSALSGLTDNVTGIKGTRKGELHLDLRKTHEGRTLNYRNLVCRSLGETVTVRPQTHEIAAECWDLDKIMTKLMEGIRVAIFNFRREYRHNGKLAESIQ